MKMPKGYGYGSGDGYGKYPFWAVIA